MRELSLHILDLVTNSIEADSTRVIIAIQESVKSNLLKITIRDNGKGMSKDMVENVLDPFMTTRTTRSVGMGLSLMKQSAMDSGGDLTITSIPGKGTQVNIDLQLGHINRSPLGDLADTIINLIIGTIDVHFVLYHKTDSGKFCFDSYWMLARMAEKECSLYALINPAKEFINKGLKKISAIN